MRKLKLAKFYPGKYVEWLVISEYDLKFEDPWDAQESELIVAGGVSSIHSISKLAFLISKNGTGFKVRVFSVNSDWGSSLDLGHLLAYHTYATLDIARGWAEDFVKARYESSFKGVGSSTQDGITWKVDVEGKIANGLGEKSGLHYSLHPSMHPDDEEVIPDKYDLSVNKLGHEVYHTAIHSLDGLKNGMSVAGIIDKKYLSTGKFYWITSEDSDIEWEYPGNVDFKFPENRDIDPDRILKIGIGMKSGNVFVIYQTGAYFQADFFSSDGTFLDGSDSSHTFQDAVKICEEYEAEE